MKLWRYYLKPDKDSCDRDERLYALSIDKKYAKEFESNRDMSRFRKIVSDEDDAFVIEILNSNRDKVIDMHSIYTSNVENGEYSVDSMEMIMPLHEQIGAGDTEHVLAVLEDDTVIHWSDSLPFEIYNSEIRDALRIFQYPETRAVTFRLETGYSYPHMAVDELGMYIRSYRETLK